MAKKRPLMVGGAIFTLTVTSLVVMALAVSALYMLDGGPEKPPQTTTTSTTTTTTTTTLALPAEMTAPETAPTYATTTTTYAWPSTTISSSATTTTFRNPLPDYSKYSLAPKIEKNLVPDSCYTTYADKGGL